MTRYLLAGRFGPGDEVRIPDVGGTHVTTLDLVKGVRGLDHGIGRMLKDLRELHVRPSEIGVDLMIVAALVHAADTRINRTAASQDGWTREISLLVPVSDPELWNAQAALLARMLRFLTGDHWDVAFRERAPGFEALSIQALPEVEAPGFDGIALYSGGLDSLIGALDFTADGERPLFVSHAGEGAVSKPQADLFDAMATALAHDQRANRPIARVRFALRFQRGLIAGMGGEDSTRGRSFLFLAKAALAGSGLTEPFKLRIPENGLIALNVPLDPTRIGSNSTRTTHPYYLWRWNELLSGIGIRGTVENPYQYRTKGEMIQECRNPERLRELITSSVSCAHPSLKRYYRDDFNHCGTCVPCIIRRAAIEHAYGVGNDPTGYRCEDLTAEPLDSMGRDGKQVRGFQYALDRLAENPRLARTLIHKPGPLREDLKNLDKLARVYSNGMNEVGRLLERVRTFSSAMPDRP